MIPESSLQNVGYKNAYETTFQLHNIVVQGAAVDHGFYQVGIVFLMF